MPNFTVATAMMACSSGSAPVPLNVVGSTVTIANMPAAKIVDAIPMNNIMLFGTCSVLTSAASGTPTPCAPATTPWTPGMPTVMVNNIPACSSTDICTCSVGGSITISFPGEVTVSHP